MPAESGHAPRIFCIGRNYAEHIRELGNEHTDECIVFIKPHTCQVPTGHDVPIPADRGSVHHELELVIVIGKPGRKIPASEALGHVSGFTLGIDLTLRDLQARLKKAGSPWERCKAFDHSAPIGDVMPYRGDVDLGNIDMTLKVNGQIRQSGNSRDMLFPIPRLIETLSMTWQLLPGDLIYTGTPPGVGPVAPGDQTVLESPQIGRFSWSFTLASP